jgi:hypothetical protein
LGKSWIEFWKLRYVCAGNVRHQYKKGAIHNVWLLHQQINYLFRPRPPNALSSSSPSLFGCGMGVCRKPDASALDTSTSIRFPLAFPAWAEELALFSGSSNLASLSNHPGATLLFSASSLAAIASSQAFNSRSASSLTFWIYACNALHDAIISSGCAAWPEEDTTYWDFSSPDPPVDEGGSVDGRVLYV